MEKSANTGCGGRRYLYLQGKENKEEGSLKTAI
jgi:hypothetical protein